MTSDIVAKLGAEPEPAVVADKPCQLSIHVGFNQLPVTSYPSHSEGKESVEYGPPFLRFPVYLSAKDAAILENILDSAAIALIGFEVQDGDGRTRSYRAVTPRE